LASASTLDDEVVAKIKTLAMNMKDEKKPSSIKSKVAAEAVGMVLAERSKVAKIEKVVFDRNGFLYTGRVQAVAEGARQGGLNF